MHLEEEVWEQARKVKVTRLGDLLGVYDQVMRRYSVDPASKEAVSLYALILGKFRRNKHSLKEDIDPNTFSFGKQERNKGVDLTGIKKQLFQTRRQSHGKPSRKTTTSLRVAPSQDQFHVIREDVIKLQAITKRGVFTRLRWNKSYRKVQKSQTKVIGVVLMSRLKRFHRKYVHQRLLNLHKLSVVYKRGEQGVSRGLKMLRLNSERMKELQAVTWESLRVNRLWECVCRMRDLMLERGQTREKGDECERRLTVLAQVTFFRRLLQHNQQVQGRQSLFLKAQQAKSLLLRDCRAGLFSRLAESHRLLEETTEKVRSSLFDTRRRRTIRTINSPQARRREFLASHDPRLIEETFGILEALCVKLDKGEVLAQIQRVKQLQDTSRILLRQKMVFSFQTLTSYHRTFSQKEQRLRDLCLSSKIHEMRINTLQRTSSQLTSKHHQLQHHLFKRKADLLMTTLSQSHHRSQCSLVLESSLRHNKLSRSFQTLHSLHLIKKQRRLLANKAQTHNLQTTLRRYFRGYKRLVKQEKYEQKILFVVRQQKTLALQQRIFNTLREEAVGSKILHLKTQTITQILQLRSKERVFSNLRSLKSAPTPAIISKLHRCFGAWVRFTKEKLLKKLVLASLQRDNNLHTLRSCFEGLRVYTHTKRHQKSLQYSAISRILSNRRQKAFSMVVSGAIKALRVRTIVSQLRLLCLRVCFTRISLWE